MSVVTEQVELMRRLSNGNTVRAGNTVQITDAEGNPVGASAGLFVHTLTPTLDTAVNYAAGDGVGGIQTIAGAVEVAGGQLELKSVHVRDKAGQAPALRLYFFAATPAAGTYTDNAPLVWGANDAANQVGLVDIAAANYITVAGVSAQTLSAIGQVHTVTATSLFVLIVANGAYNAASTSDLIITLSWERK